MVVKGGFKNMLTLFDEWFGQGFSIGQLIVNVVFFTLGMFLSYKFKDKKKKIVILVINAILVFLCMLYLAYSYSYFSIIVVLVGGILFMVLIGQIVASIITRIIKLKRNQ